MVAAVPASPRVQNGVAAYFGGHEHVFQHHKAGGVQHVVCGASGAMMPMLYGGPDKGTAIDWMDRSGSSGFTAVQINAKRMRIQFIRADNGGILTDVTIPNPALASTTAAAGDRK